MRITTGRLVLREFVADDWREVLAYQSDPGHEIAPSHWGSGYATEAARAMLAFGFDELELDRIQAFLQYSCNAIAMARGCILAIILLK